MKITEQVFMKMTLRTPLLVKRTLYTGFYGNVASQLYVDNISEAHRQILSPRKAFLFRRELVKCGLFLAKSSAEIMQACLSHLHMCNLSCWVHHDSFDGLDYTHATTFRDCTVLKVTSMQKRRTGRSRMSEGDTS